MAYFESITAGRGGLDSFNQALNNQRYANLALNESMGNFLNTIANAGSLFDNAKIREDALKYQRMRDLANDKKQAEAFELQKRQAEQSMDFAKRQQIMSEETHRQNKGVNEQRLKAMQQENRLNEHQFKWLMKATPSAKASALVSNDAMKTPTTQATTPSTQNTLNTPIAKPKPKTITKEEFQALYANPFFRY
ncbi:hypothetical protein OHP008_11370 [Helicobacter pylori]|uniref:hypothetical protein n=1 Tax=Helicobacter pylori TaxID=210 RepID=UPI001CC33D4B|nr:hypothetical protein [Helicobacter pylori]WRD83284.1 hypothetical protein E5E58_04420 [Helicobacter pylori]BDA08502.1 hypothetical protein OHP008_11370 [Helicobacter pylori]